VATPSNVDLRGALGPVRHQDHRPTCLAFAASTAHEHARNDPEQLSPEALFAGCTQRDPLAPTLGTKLSVVLAALEEDGQCTEAAWPYGAADVMDAAATFYRARPDGRENNGLVAFVRTRLAVGRSVILTLRLTEAWQKVGSDGLIAPPSAADRFLGGHAVVAVGYDTGAQRILVRNSWGARWGDGGHGWVPEEYLDQYGYEGVELITLPVPAVTGSAAL
jgi:C1A family cysteine protease